MQGKTNCDIADKRNQQFKEDRHQTCLNYVIEKENKRCIDNQIKINIGI